MTTNAKTQQRHAPALSGHAIESSRGMGTLESNPRARQIAALEPLFRSIVTHTYIAHIAQVGQC